MAWPDFGESIHIGKSREFYERQAQGILFDRFTSDEPVKLNSEQLIRLMTPYYEQGLSHERVQELADVLEYRAAKWEKLERAGVRIADVIELGRKVARFNKGFVHDGGSVELEESFKQALAESGPSNGGWMASELLTIARAALGPREGNKYLKIMRDRARERYRQGYYADPFTNNPKMREA